MDPTIPTDSTNSAKHFKNFFAGFLILAVLVFLHAMAWLYPEETLQSGIIGGDGNGLKPWLLGIFFFLIVSPLASFFVLYLLLLSALSYLFNYDAWRNRVAIAWVLFVWVALAAAVYIGYAYASLVLS